MADEQPATMRGAFNFRDLGGHPTVDGRRVKRGLVYRSDDLTELDGSDLAYLAGLGLKTVVDFRGRDEMTHFPDRLPASVTNHIAIPIEAGRLMRNLFDGNASLKKSMVIMISVYRTLVNDFQEQFREFFRLLADADNLSLLFHCTAGKDRTGLAAAYLLSALGVDRETIVADYLLSRERLRSKYIVGIDYQKDMEPLYSVAPEFIQTAFEVIDGQYGGMEEYLDKRLEVDRELFKSMYTEEIPAGGM